MEKSEKQIKILRKAYDKTVEDYEKGIDPLRDLPKELKEIGEGSSINSGSSEFKDFLNPRK